MSRQPPQWDRYSIIAELGRRGLTLSGVAEQAGLKPRTCSLALTHSTPKGERALADALQVALHELFPDRWSESGQRLLRRGRPRGQKHSHSRQKCTLTTVNRIAS
ncbi:MAG: hypothetical protein EAZ99_14575 [Alphaproteobacteria bacterium]|nr:MAG: hypothetical protein EAZ99_14575 [Alphaproteobacteria bacterium]